MIIYAVYLITNDGRVLMSEVFQSPENIPDEALIGAFLTGISSFGAEITQGKEMQHLEMSGLSYHFKAFTDFQVVLVSNTQTKPGTIIDRLGWQFLRNYGENLDRWTGNQNIFDDYRNFLHDIISQHSTVDIGKQIDPSKRLSTADIFKLPKHLQETAMTMLSLERASLEEISTEISQTPDLTETYLNELQNLGYVGMKQMEQETMYFVSIN